MTGDFFVVAIVGGIFAFLTPCVFPMLPITLAYFGRGTPEKPSRSPAGWFAAGIIGSFTLLGLLIAVLFGAAGVTRFAANPEVNLVLAAIFVVFAANLFGLFELPIPSEWLTRVVKSSNDADPRSIGGAVLLGAVFALTSLTCTTPFVGSLLVMAARGERTLPLTGMLLFSTAFALPFYLLARAPRLLDRLPRAGSWIKSLRVCVGFVELAAAVKFVANADVVSNWGVVTRPVVLIAWASLAVTLAIYLTFKAAREKSLRAGIVGAIECSVLAVALIYAARGKEMKYLEPYLPPVRQAADAAIDPDEPWILNDYRGALATASQSRKLIFVDFTGYTCTNCRWMESNIFDRPDVRAELSEFVLSRLYTDGEGKMFEDQQAFQEKNFGTVALPLYAIVDWNGRTVATKSGISRDPEEFILFLKSAKPKLIAAGN
jgi:thiol:disulfide interchange protein DsbD